MKRISLHFHTKRWDYTKHTIDWLGKLLQKRKEFKNLSITKKFILFCVSTYRIYRTRKVNLGMSNRENKECIINLPNHKKFLRKDLSREIADTIKHEYLHLCMPRTLTKKVSKNAEERIVRLLCALSAEQYP